MGYYPTPARTLLCIAEMLYAVGNCCILDPCCGDGNALAEIADKLKAKGAGVTTYGIEVDKARAERAKNRLNRLLYGSIFDVMVRPAESFSMIYLNPPYDYEDGERTETKFLKHAHRWLKTDGVMVFVVPEYVLSNSKLTDWICQNYRDIRVFRFTRTEYPAFRQVVMFAVKKKGEDDRTMFPSEYPFIEDVSGTVYTIPEGVAPQVFELKEMTDEEILAIKPRTISHIRDCLRMSSTTENVLSPLFPLKKGHMVSLLMSGILNGKIGDVVIKCYTDRVVNERVEEHNGEIKRIETHTYISGIRVIERGRWYDVR